MNDETEIVYMLVPYKPTPEMLKAGGEWSALPEQTWQDMIDASPIHNEAERLAEENERLRHIVSDCAAALVNGAFVSPKATVEFMEWLPKEISVVVSGLRSRAEKAEAERDMHERASAKWYQSYQFKEATCEKLAKALEESRAAHLLLIAPQHIVGSSVIEALTKVTAAELSARTALSEYRKEASE